MTTYTLITAKRRVVCCRDLTDFKRARMDAHREYIKAQRYKKSAAAKHEQQLSGR